MPVARRLSRVNRLLSPWGMSEPSFISNPSEERLPPHLASRSAIRRVSRYICQIPNSRRSFAPVARPSHFHGDEMIKTIIFVLVYLLPFIAHAQTPAQKALIAAIGSDQKTVAAAPVATL